MRAGAGAGQGDQRPHPTHTEPACLNRAPPGSSAPSEARSSRVRWCRGARGWDVDDGRAPCCSHEPVRSRGPSGVGRPGGFRVNAQPLVNVSQGRLHRRMHKQMWPSQLCAPRPRQDGTPLWGTNQCSCGNADSRAEEPPQRRPDSTHRASSDHTGTSHLTAGVCKPAENG